MLKKYRYILFAILIISVTLNCFYIIDYIIDQYKVTSVTKNEKWHISFIQQGVLGVATIVVNSDGTIESFVYY